MKTFVRLIKNEFKRIFNNGVLLAIFFGAPIVYGLLFGYVYKEAKVTDIPIVVVDEDNSVISDKIIDALDVVESLKIVKIKRNSDNLSVLMQENDYAAIVKVPTHFETDILQKKYPEIQVELNLSNILIANFASKNIQKVLETIKVGIEVETLNKKGVPRNEAFKKYESFKTNYHKIYNSKGNYQLFMLPGLLGAIMQQVIFLALALVFARDFEDAYFKKLIRVSKNPFFLVCLKALPFVLLIAVDWLLIGSFYNYFNIELDVFNTEILLLISLLSLASMFLGMLFSIVFPSQLKATEFLMVISTPAFVLSGFTWPRMAMPLWIQKISYWIPLTPFLDAFKKVSFFGANFGQIKPEINQLLLLSLLAFIAIVISLKLKIYFVMKRDN